jgi:uracil-DNA glycosylase
MLTLIGQAPNSSDAPSEPLAGRSGLFLARLAGVSLDEFLSVTSRVNLIKRWPGKSGVGDRFPMREAREGVERLIVLGALWRRAVLCGVGVARAFGLTHPELFKWWPGGVGSYAVIPHPSGLNRMWNDSSVRRRGKAFLVEALENFADI